MSSLKKKLRILHNRKVEAEKQKLLESNVLLESDVENILTAETEKQALAETKIEDFEDKMKRLRDRKKQKSFEE